MQPLVIVPNEPDGKAIVADAGSIVKLLNQQTLYRDRVSPITKRADEILVQYGKPKEPTLGWITNKIPPDAMKPVQGPTFLVTTQAEGAISAWDAFRLKIARTRKSNPAMWFAPWLVLNGKKYSREVREVTRLFGGKPIKNEEFQVRCERLFQLILHTEIDMSAAKAKNIASKKSGKNKSKKQKGGEDEAPVKKNKKGKGKVKADKPEKKSKSGGKEKKSSGDFSPRSRDFDNHVIKRLIQENPRRAGSEKAKVWDKLKKGMTVGQFAEKGGSRAIVAFYIENGWVKLLRPSGE
jgi:hypothetical protein